MGHSRGARASRSGTKGDEVTGVAATSHNNSSRRTKNKRRRRAAIDVKERRQSELRFSAMTKRQQRKAEKKARGDGRRAPQPSF